jgi:membrane protease subunit (stomatin/prohibitin family)
MSQSYKVIESYTTDAGTIEAGSVVELSDEQAKPLLDEGKIATEEAASADAPAADAPSEEVPAGVPMDTDTTPSAPAGE